ncbi:hypothetical protein J6590_020353 [Homalodisca vitripennis]|nr:hypothetical protein J6590_020353 [Homalodisca vitripennis]
MHFSNLNPRCTKPGLYSDTCCYQLLSSHCLSTVYQVNAPPILRGLLIKMRANSPSCRVSKQRSPAANLTFSASNRVVATFLCLSHLPLPLHSSPHPFGKGAMSRSIVSPIYIRQAIATKDYHKNECHLYLRNPKDVQERYITNFQYPDIGVQGQDLVSTEDDFCFDWRCWYRVGLPFSQGAMTEIITHTYSLWISTRGGPYSQPYPSRISCHSATEVFRLLVLREQQTNMA